MAEKWRPPTLAGELATMVLRAAGAGDGGAQVDPAALIRCPGTAARPCGRRVPLDHMVRVVSYPPHLRPREGEHLCSACRKYMVRAGLMTTEQQAMAHGAPPEMRARARQRDGADRARRERAAARRGR